MFEKLAQHYQEYLLLKSTTVKIYALKFNDHFLKPVNSYITKEFSSSNYTFKNNSNTDHSIINLNMFTFFTCNSMYFDLGGVISEMKTTTPLELANKAYN